MANYFLTLKNYEVSTGAGYAHTTTKIWRFENVKKLIMQDGTLTVGYCSEDGEYHEETNDIPDLVELVKEEENE